MSESSKSMILIYSDVENEGEKYLEIEVNYQKPFQVLSILSIFNYLIYSENKLQYQELKIPEPRSMESQQQQSSSSESYRKQFDHMKLNWVNSRKKWPSQEVMQQNCYREVK